MDKDIRNTHHPTTPQSTDPYISIALMPMECLSDDPKLELFCSGMVMDIITDLSRFRSFRIIAYDAVKQLASKVTLDREQLNALEIEYLVKGLARAYGDQLLFNLQLIHLPENRLVWAERFGGKREELFSIQEAITERIVSSLPTLVDYDILRSIQQKASTNFTAYEHCLYGFQALEKGSVAADEEARQYFQKAIELAPYYSRAYLGMSMTYFNEWSCQLWHSWEVSKKGAYEWAKKAVELDERDHFSLSILGRVHLFDGNYELAEHCLRKSMRLNPNDADNLMRIAWTLVYLDYKEEALELYHRAKKLNPGDDVYLQYGSFIHFELGNFEESIRLGRKVPPDKTWVDFPAYLAAAYYYLGDKIQMQEQWQTYLERFTELINKGKPADDITAIAWTRDVNPYKGATPVHDFLNEMGKGLQLPSVGVPSPISQNQFIPENGFWRIRYAGETIELSDLKGLHDIAAMLAQPNTELHCTELLGTAIEESGVVVFDEQAKRSYQQKILELQEELAEAEEFQQSERIQQLQKDYDALLGQLSSAMGKGGKSRKLSDPIDKARSAVTWRIRSAIKRISKVHEPLGKHLSLAIKTGVFCKYQPEQDIDWVLTL